MTKYNKNELKNYIVKEIYDQKNADFGTVFIKDLQPKCGKSITEEINADEFRKLTEFSPDELAQFNRLLSTENKYNYIWIGLHDVCDEFIVTVVGRTSFLESSNRMGDLFNAFPLKGTMLKILNEITKMTEDTLYHELNKYTTSAIIIPFKVKDDSYSVNNIEVYVRNIVTPYLKSKKFSILNIN